VSCPCCQEQRSDTGYECFGSHIILHMQATASVEP
jgi:hypothetical protein